MWQRGSSHLIRVGPLVSSLGALLLVTGCASQLPDASSQGPIPASSTPSRVVLEPGIQAKSTEPPEVASGVEEQRTPMRVHANGDDVEEVVVVGNRIRRWLPIVGAAWPDKDCRLSVRVIGAGVRRSVFVADLGRSGQAWRHVAQNLATEGEEHVLVTLPGSAGNRPCTWRGAVLQDASRLVAELLGDGGGAVSLIGDAFGGQVALKVASNVDPDRIHNVVLFDVVPYPWELQSLLVKAYRRTHPPTVFAAQARVAPPGYWSAASGLGVRAVHDFIDKAARSEVMKTLGRSDPVTMSYEFSRGIGPTSDLRPLVRSVARPVLAIWPTGPAGNERTDRDAVEAQYADIKHVVWRTIEGRGAGAMLEAPALVAAHIEAFWREVGFREDR